MAAEGTERESDREPGKLCAQHIAQEQAPPCTHPELTVGRVLSGGSRQPALGDPGIGVRELNKVHRDLLGTSPTTAGAPRAYTIYAAGACAAHRSG